MDRMDNTIAAISTPYGEGGIGVIRISGGSALDVAKRVFRPVSVKSVGDMDGYTTAYGEIVDDKGELIDTGILSIFKSPRSYTGEDVAEISCHGGIYVTNYLLHLILESGARLAEPGEFSKRAFLNGKMSLTQAESVMDIISAKSTQAVRMAAAAGEGKLYEEIGGISKDLIELSAYFAAWFDYPEEEMQEYSYDDVDKILHTSFSRLDKLIMGYGQGKIIKEGIPTVIVGKPNVGKSTLMNLFAGVQRSIVTDIPGTTRDIIEESVRVGDLILNISDTAGIRSTDDVVERFGVELAEKRIDSSHLILAVFDGSVKLSDDDKRIARLVDKKNTIAIVNKSDLSKDIDTAFLEENFEKIIYISAKQEKGIDELKNAIAEVLMLDKFDPSAAVLANERQLEAARQAHDYLKECIESLHSGVTYDLISVVLESALDCLLQLSGERAGDKIVETVFARFCLGK